MIVYKDAVKNIAWELHLKKCRSHVYLNRYFSKQEELPLIK